MSRNKESGLNGIEWIQAPHHGPLAKPGLEGAACYGSHTCIARPQRQVFHSTADFERYLEAAQNTVGAVLAGRTAA